MRYYIVSGEASGDLHASNLVKQIKINDHDAVIRGWGGDLMQKEGVQLVKHYRELAFMGFAEVVMHLSTIFRNIEFCKQDIVTFKPDVLILVDYPGFNLRIAKFAKEAGFKIVYYISPHVWAWKASRVHLIKKVVDRMMVILPFEKAFYEKYDYNADFVGHPLLDVIHDTKPDREMFIKMNNLYDKPIVALLPGSRRQEVLTMLPLMAKTAKNFPQYQFVIAAAPSALGEWYIDYLTQSNIKIVYDKTYLLLQNSIAALVTSGTATLEAALWGVPEVLCYKTQGVTGAISYQIAKQLVGKRLKFIGLVNLIMEREVTKELIQNALTVENLTMELKKLLDDPACIARMKEDYKHVREKLGGPGASARAAQIVAEVIAPLQKTA
ncbi:MAG TPA: lipid-A-disaccharide synthase [Bacteroidia bacterium]|jgi:lipid-A-disaccharide synthase|nr:lipid-A-disaccharide synthase [Bacteroidia bacterium]